MWCAACRVTYTEKRPHPAGAHCPECLHPYNTIAPNPFSGARHYGGCSRVDSAANVPSRKAAARMQQRHRQEIEDRQKGVPMPKPGVPGGLDAMAEGRAPVPTTAEYGHWSGCNDPDCVRCSAFEAAIDLGYDQLTGA